MTIESTRPTKRRSKVWIYYAVLSGASFVGLCLGQAACVAGWLLFGVYAVYLYRGGRFVLWFW